MFQWLTKHPKEVDGTPDLVPERAQLSNRLKRIVDDHERAMREVRPPEPVHISGLLPPPNYRREFIGRYDSSRRTIFPFNEQLWTKRVVR
jgi:hypothetical protein